MKVIINTGLCQNLSVSGRAQEKNHQEGLLKPEESYRGQTATINNGVNDNRDIEKYKKEPLNSGLSPE